MFYHIIVEKKSENNKEKSFNIFSYDLEKEFVVDKIVKPYLESKTFIVDRYALDASKIERLKIVNTEQKIDELVSYFQSRVPRNVIMVYRRSDVVTGTRNVLDVTQKIIDEVSDTIQKMNDERKKISQQEDSKYVFIVHGHDINRVTEIENLIRSIGFEPIVLFKEADSGQTIIEKIETYTDKACYGIVLYSKCDLGYAVGHEEEIKPRARQNVVFEHGYLMAKLHRDHVCALVDGDDIEKPSDISGILYQSIDNSGNWKYRVARNMRAVGIDVDLNKIK